MNNWNNSLMFNDSNHLAVFNVVASFFMKPNNWKNACMLRARRDQWNILRLKCEQISARIRFWNRLSNFETFSDNPSWNRNSFSGQRKGNSEIANYLEIKIFAQYREAADKQFSTPQWSHFNRSQVKRFNSKIYPSTNHSTAT